MTAASVTLSAGHSSHARDRCSAKQEPLRRRVESRDAPELARSVLALLAPTGAGVRAVTLSQSPERGSIRFSIPKYGRRIADAGGGVLVFLDRGVREVEHVHGLLTCADDFDPLGAWVDQTGANRSVQRCRRVDEVGIERWLPYCLKRPATGPPRDLVRDVWTSGLLAEAWRVFVTSAGSEAMPAVKGAPEGGKALQQGRCDWCGRELPTGRRSHASFCRPSHRVRMCEWRKARLEVPRIGVQSPLFVETTSARGTKAAQTRSRGDGR